MTNPTNSRFARILAGLGALALAGGCHLALSSFTKRTSASSEPPRQATSVAQSPPGPAPAPTPAPATPPAPAPAPAPPPPPPPPRAVEADAEPEGEPQRKRESPQPRAEHVTYHVNERVRPGTFPICSVSGRGEVCDGVCTDVQISDLHCGACGIRCNPGNHCDFSTCRDAEGKPQ